MSLRMERVNSELRKQIMAVIRKDVDDPALDFLSITRVVTTRDLRESKVYFSLLEEDSYKSAKTALNKMRGVIRNSLGKKVRLKVLPQLVFIVDESMKYSVDISQKLEDIKNEQKNT